MHTFGALITALLLLGTATPGISGDDSILKPRTSHRTPPPLVLLDLAGKRHALEEYRGKVVVINFFGTWCTPCLQEMPSLLQLTSALKDSAFAVLAVDVGDSPARLRQVFGEQQRAGFTILLDSTKMVARNWRALAFPTSFVLDSEGLIQFSAEGPVDWNNPEVAEQIAGLLPKASSPASDADSGSSRQWQSGAPRSD
jgi:thiol-disulfide isomerase/thioredoxin